MSLKYAILGLLSHAPMTGYCLKANFDGPMYGFWSVSYGGLYPALHKMSAAGLIEVEELKDARKQKRYHLTTKGQVELKKWFAEKTATPITKDEYLLKLFLSRELNNRERIHLLQEYVEIKRDNLQQLQDFADQKDTLLFHSGNKILLSYSLKTLESEIEILKELIAKEESE